MSVDLLLFNLDLQIKLENISTATSSRVTMDVDEQHWVPSTIFGNGFVGAPAQSGPGGSADSLTLSFNPERGPGVIILACVYSLLFLIGICGNAGICWLMIRILRSASPSRIESSFVQILALSCVDLLMMLSLPLTISDIVLTYWVFGNVVCKIYWLIESTGKIMSTFILTLMSFDRYIQICHPGKMIHLRSSKHTVISLALLSLMALLVLSPLPYFAQETPFSPLYILTAKEAQRYGVAMYKCMLGNQSLTVLRIFSWNLFAVGFVLPLLLIAFFYAMILWKIRQHQQNSLARSQFSLIRVIVHTMVIVLFYFICWCPYWIGVLYTNNRSPSGEFQENPSFVYLMYGIHALPFLNSAFNWVFHAMLNEQLRRKKETLNQRSNSHRRRVLLSAGGGGGVGGGVGGVRGRWRNRGEGGVFGGSVRLGPSDRFRVQARGTSTTMTSRPSFAAVSSSAAALCTIATTTTQTLHNNQTLTTTGLCPNNIPLNSSSRSSPPRRERAQTECLIKAAVQNSLIS